MIGNIMDKEVEVSLAMKVKRNKNQVKRAGLKVKRARKVGVARKVKRAQRKKIRKKDQILIDNKNIIYKQIFTYLFSFLRQIYLSIFYALLHKMEYPSIF